MKFDDISMEWDLKVHKFGDKSNEVEPWGAGIRGIRQSVVKWRN